MLNSLFSMKTIPITFVRSPLSWTIAVWHRCPNMQRISSLKRESDSFKVEQLLFVEKCVFDPCSDFVIASHKLFALVGTYLFRSFIRNSEAYSWVYDSNTTLVLFYFDYAHPYTLTLTITRNIGNIPFLIKLSRSIDSRRDKWVGETPSNSVHDNTAIIRNAGNIPCLIQLSRLIYSCRDK